MSKFYIISTPIGNLEDITLRALRVLKETDLVLCEDTRVTKKLFSHYGISTPTMSYHAHSGETKVENIFKEISTGKNIALVTDAGTPGISDPGSILISQIRERFPDIHIISIPGFVSVVEINPTPHVVNIPFPLGRCFGNIKFALFNKLFYTNLFLNFFFAF